MKSRNEGKFHLGMECGKQEELEDENRESMNRRNSKCLNKEIMRGNQCWMQVILTARRKSGGERREKAD